MPSTTAKVNGEAGGSPDWTHKLRHMFSWGNIKELGRDSVGVLSRLTSLPLPEAFARLGIVLAASLFIIILITTVDSGYLTLYVSLARRGAGLGG
eukprot:CAMPEP_0202875076 /NCGR_PEP_ID=MMETSP1391-20130828/26552_1 /ASSEMBLY_ACC=CAM_ASM_000867 /TAXON_ID=1034604 /ORGANISM="Chlamydomonas leiostraca, Strain SAG 11-49" /LENGTH=94 /DNA_ID=CAMNT_0049556667 /DNA_START=114 /DNA_END=399 /DNA_ORIENTATION=-